MARGTQKVQQQETQQDNGRVPAATPLTPPKMVGRGKKAIHSPEVIKSIAEAAAKGWTGNGLTYKTKHAAQGACQTVKEAIVTAKLAEATSDLTSRVWETEGEYIFAIRAKNIPES